MFSCILQDLNANRKNPKIMFVLTFFRFTSLVYRNKGTRILGSPILILYRVVVEWILGIEIHWSTRIGKGLTLHHGY